MRLLAFRGHFTAYDQAVIERVVFFAMRDHMFPASRRRQALTVIRNQTYF